MYFKAGVERGHQDLEGGFQSSQDPPERGCQAGAPDSGEDVRKPALSSGKFFRSSIQVVHCCPPLTHRYNSSPLIFY